MFGRPLKKAVHDATVPHRVKLAVDPTMIRNLPVPEMLRAVADVGFEHVELSPRLDLLPPSRGRRASREGVAQIASAARETGVGIASLFVVYPWASPDEQQRAAAVRYLAQACEVAVELGCERLNTELTGDPRRPLESEAAFWRSIDDVVPLLDRHSLTLAVEPHPYDFIEDGDQAVDLVRGVRSDRVRYLYCAPHTFTMGGDMRSMIEYSSDVLAHVHVADTFRPQRTIVNPPGDWRIHQHLDVGQGEVDWTEFFAALRRVGFDDVMTVTVFAWEDRAIESFRANLAAVKRHLAVAESA
jgi:myo-inositol catabolism protein IolH